MTEKPPTAIGRSHLFKDASISALKLRAENLGLVPYASLYGDKRKRETWEKLLEHEPELEPLQPRQLEKFTASDYQRVSTHYGILLSVGAIALLCLLKPLYSKHLPIQIDLKIQLTGQK